ncbi:hypothetical protein [Streptomyces sp. NPDC060031]
MPGRGALKERGLHSVWIPPQLLPVWKEPLKRDRPPPGNAVPSL